MDQQNYGRLGSGQEVLHKLGIEKKDIPDAIKTLLRTLESLRDKNVFEKVSTSPSFSRRSSTWPIYHTDAIALRLQDRESIERDIRELKAVYGEPVPTLPSWAITKFEIDLGEIIGRGFFSTVYKGKWGTRVVAVKAVEVYTSKESFVDEVNVWKELKHPNILQLYGASSVEGTPPWFLVSPFMIHRNLADYLKRVYWNLQRHKESGSAVLDAGHRRVDFLQMMHDVAKGMRYLHDHGIYHGDLKAANVLVTEHLHCVVSDFGLSNWIYQSEQRNLLPNHALRWQAPELMAGDPVPTNKADVYAFAMCCVEILTMGSIPWPTMKDDDVRQYVLVEEGRPPYPASLVRDLKFETLLHKSWHQSPYNRPSFEQLVQIKDVPEVFHFSPRTEYSSPSIMTLDKLESGIEVPYSDESEVVSPLENNMIDFSSPGDPPSTFNKDANATVKEPYEDQFELTYRMCLSHEFPRQRFLSRGGQFMRLFNSFHPRRSSSGRMNIPGVENVCIPVGRQEDNFVRKGFKAISKLASTGESGLK
ncbi:hypothetical protein C0992_008377 [Termitomyces sp. T32_za158]|nr:hypothetical protein C0992_008377 [Termitomyces sp. T32_za158]